MEYKLKKEDLRCGNYVWGVGGNMYLEIYRGPFRIDDISYDEVSSKIYVPFANEVNEFLFKINHLRPLELDIVWKKLLQINYEYPESIKQVHEFQNWYRYKYGKEINTEKVPLLKEDGWKGSLDMDVIAKMYEFEEADKLQLRLPFQSQ